MSNMRCTKDLQPEALKQFEKTLMEEKNRLTQTISRLEETGIGDTMSDSIGELSMYDNHPADLGDAMFERSKDVALRDNEHILLEQVETALDRISAGSYGICESCNKAIDTDRLEALPWATRCIDCQEDKDVVDTTPRPLEEEVLAPPFHRTFLDTANFNFVGFDGEDALQSVLKWGSSDSPQDIPGSYDYKALWPNSNEHQGIVAMADAIPDDTSDTQTHADKQRTKNVKTDT